MLGEDQYGKKITIEQLTKTILSSGGDVDLKEQILGYFLIGNTWTPADMLGMKKDSEYVDNASRSDNKIDGYMLARIEAKNRVYR